MNRKIIAFIILFVIIMPEVPFQKAEAITNIQGSGTPDNPYIITSNADMEAMNASRSHFRLANNITVTTEIGLFGGVFDGAGYTITNNTGFFIGTMDDATIKNLTVQAYITSQKTITSSSTRNGYAVASAIARNGRGTFDRCIIRGYIAGNTHSIKENGYHGYHAHVAGLAGWGHFTVIRCANEATISFSQGASSTLAPTSNSYVAGLIGEHESGTVSESFNRGSISSDVYCVGTGTMSLYTYAGALVGHSKGYIENSYSTGSIYRRATKNSGQQDAVAYSQGLMGGINLRAVNCHVVNSGLSINNNYYTDSITATYEHTLTIIQNLGWNTSAVWNVSPSKNNGFAYLRWEDDIAPSATLISPQYDTISKENVFYLNKAFETVLRPPLFMETYNGAGYSYQYHCYEWGASANYHFSKPGASGIKLYIDNLGLGMNSSFGIYNGSTELALRFRGSYNVHTLLTPWTQEFGYSYIEAKFSSDKNWGVSTAYSIDRAVYKMNDAEAMKPVIRFGHQNNSERLTLKYSILSLTTGVYHNSQGVQGNMYVYDTEYADYISGDAYRSTNFQLKLYASDLPDGAYKVDMWTITSSGRKSNTVTAYYNIDRTPPPPPYEDLITTVTVDPPELKSGYGFTANVTVQIDTNIEEETEISTITKVLAYFPDDSYNKGYELVKTSQNVMTSTWEFPINPKSKIGAKKWYVPVDFPDKTDYIVIFEVITSKNNVFDEQTCSIFIDGNMFEDDKTFADYSIQ